MQNSVCLRQWFVAFVQYGICIDGLPPTLWKLFILLEPTAAVVCIPGQSLRNNHLVLCSACTRAPNQRPCHSVPECRSWRYEAVLYQWLIAFLSPYSGHFIAGVRIAQDILDIGPVLLQCNIRTFYTRSEVKGTGQFCSCCSIYFRCSHVELYVDRFQRSRIFHILFLEYFLNTERIPEIAICDTS